MIIDSLYEIRHKIYMKCLPLIFYFKYYVYPGNPIPEWNFLTFAAVQYMKTLLNENIQTSDKFIRDSFSLGRIYKRDGVRFERVDIPFEYRVKAQNIVKEKLMSDLSWYPLDPIDESKVDPLYGEWHIPENESTDERKAFLFAHGGAYMFSSVEVHRNITYKLAAESNVRCFSVEYRLAPEWPFPAQLEDTLACYLYLTDKKDTPHQNWNPNELVFGGDSAGAGIVIGLLLLIRDKLISDLPRGVFLLSSYIDLPNSLPSHSSNKDTDYVPHVSFDESYRHKLLIHRLGKIAPKGAKNLKSNRHYVTKSKYLDYYLVSPLYAKDLTGLPPIFMQAGTREMLRDESILFAQKVKNQAQESNYPSSLPPITLQLYENMMHDFQMLSFLPASGLSIVRVANFIKRCFDSNDSTPLDLGFGPISNNPKSHFQLTQFDGTTIDKQFLEVYKLENKL